MNIHAGHNSQRSDRKQGGFTLIELLLVISIIALMSSVVFAATSIARAKANDAKKVEEVSSVKTALLSYYNDKGKMPNNYNCNSDCPGGIDPAVGGSTYATVAVEDTAHPDDANTSDSGKAYNASMNELVSGGYLSAVPRSAPNSDNPYMYYNYGPDEPQGALFATDLVTTSPAQTPATTETYEGICHPFTCTTVPGHWFYTPPPFDCELPGGCGNGFETWIPDSTTCDDSTVTPNAECSNLDSNSYCSCNPY